MTLLFSFFGAAIGAALINFIWLNKQKEKPIIPGTGTMKDHYEKEVVKKKTVYRDKEIEAEESSR